LKSADEDPSPVEGQVDHDWLARLDIAATSGSLTEDERALIVSYKASGGSARPLLSGEEKRLLSRWKNRC